MSGTIVLRVDHTVTYIDGRMDSDVYQGFKRELGYLPENAYWMVKKHTDGQNVPEWKKNWDGRVSTVCWNQASCRCHIKKNSLHFPTGLLHKAFIYLQKNNVQYNCIDIRKKTEKSNIYNMSDEFEPRDYQQHIIESVVKKNGKERGIIKCATGGGKCQNEESLCLTEEGMIEIGEIEEGMTSEEYREKQINVYTPLGDSDKDVSSHIYRDGVRDSIKITTSYGYSLTGTPNHRIIVVGDDGGFEWKRLDKITDNDIIVLSKNQNMFGSNCEWSIEEAYLLGLLYGDGSLSKKNGIQITTADDHIEEYVCAFADENGMKSSTYFDKRRESTRSVCVHNTKYRKSLLNRGVDYCLAHTKKIPLSIRTSEKPVIAAFLRGIYETDGCVEVDEKKMSITLGLSNEKLIDQIHYILLNMGIVSSKRKKKTTCRDCFVLTIYRDFIKKFIGTIGFDPEGYKREKSYKYYSDFINRKNNSNKDLIYNQNSKIREIRFIIKDILGSKKYRRIIEEESNTKINVLRSWSDRSYWRNPGRSSLSSFVKWAEYRFIYQEEGAFHPGYSRLKSLIAELIEVIDEKYYYDKIKSIEVCESDNYDFVIPKTHSFVSNGMINHNTAIASGIIAGLGVSPTVFYVPSIDLLKQAKDEIERFVRYHRIPVKVGMVGGGEKSIEDITVMTNQTAVRALGGVWKKFDDEDVTKDNTDISDMRKDIKDLIQDSRLMICDEVQHWAAETCQIISDNSISCQYRYGLSVGPSSNLELYGWIYEDGDIRSIEDLWEDVEEYSDLLLFRKQNYEIIDISSLDIESRGWDNIGKEFVWKKINKIIRHKCDKKIRKIYYRGKNNILVTDDHSVFCIPRSSDRNRSDFECLKSCDIKRKDLLLADNGENWNKDDVKDFDIFQILLKNYRNPDKIRVKVRLEGLIYSDLGMSKSRFYHIIRRNSGIDLKTYIKYKDILPKPEKIYTEGANGVCIYPHFSFRSISFLIGFFIGDGWFDGNRINFAVENSILEEFINYVNSIGVISVNPKIRKMEGASSEVRISSALLSCLMKYFLGKKYCYEKTIPSEIIFKWDKFYKMKLINGMMMSDGCFSSKQDRNRKEARYTTTSICLANDFSCLLRSLGVSSSLSIRKPQKGGIINGRQIFAKRDSYQVIFSMNSLLGNNIGRNGEVKKFKNINCNEYIINKIVEEEYSDYVYDLEMEGHPSFVVNGVLVHNSATPWRDLGDDILIDACFGKMIANISASFLIQRGYLVRPHIYFCNMNNMRGIGKSPYVTVYKKAIVENEMRNNSILNFANYFRSQGRKILILVKQVAHGKLLENMIPDSTFLYGGTGKKKRASHLDKMREGDPSVTIASVIFDEGVDCKPLDTLILAGGGKSPTRALQRIGRILRTYPGKQDAIAVDFMDGCRYLQGHSRKRERIYKTEEEFIIERPE